MPATRATPPAHGEAPNRVSGPTVPGFHLLPGCGWGVGSSPAGVGAMSRPEGVNRPSGRQSARGDVVGHMYERGRLRSGEPARWFDSTKRPFRFESGLGHQAPKTRPEVRSPLFPNSCRAGLVGGHAREDAPLWGGGRGGENTPPRWLRKGGIMKRGIVIVGCLSVLAMAAFAAPHLVPEVPIPGQPFWVVYDQPVESVTIWNITDETLFWNVPPLFWRHAWVGDCWATIIGPILLMDGAYVWNEKGTCYVLTPEGHLGKHAGFGILGRLEDDIVVDLRLANGHRVQIPFSIEE